MSGVTAKISKNFRNQLSRKINKLPLAYLDTKKDKQYKYVGQTLLATVAREVFKKAGDSFSVYGAVDSAIKFYEKVCGFQLGDLGMPYLPWDEIPKFIKQTEKRTQSQIIDLKG